MTVTKCRQFFMGKYLEMKGGEGEPPFCSWDGKMFSCRTGQMLRQPYILCPSAQVHSHTLTRPDVHF